MLFPIKNRQELKDLEEVVSLKNQVEEFRLQDNLGKQNFHENRKNLFEPVTDTVKNISENLTKTITETSINKNKALDNLNNKLLEKLNEIVNRVIITFYLLYPISRITNPEIYSQFKFVKDSSSKGVNDMLIHNTIRVN